MKHILIVEDDTTFAVMLQTWLSKKKFSVASEQSECKCSFDRNDELRGYPVGCSGDETRCERLYI